AAALFSEGHTAAIYNYPCARSRAEQGSRVACQPDQHGEFVARVDGSGKASRHRLEPLRVGTAQGVEQGPTREAEGAEPMQNGPVEATHGRELGIGMERIAVPGQTIEQRLIGAGRVGDPAVRFPLRKADGSRRPPVASPAALAPDESRAGCGP